jgi:hypothetical protein
MLSTLERLRSNMIYLDLRYLYVIATRLHFEIYITYFDIAFLKLQYTFIILYQRYNYDPVKFYMRNCFFVLVINKFIYTTCSK